MATTSRSVFVVALIFLAAGTGSVRGVRLQPDRGPQPPDRTNLITAFVAVDKLFTDFATENHVPGAAWGIVRGRTHANRKFVNW
jgi:hypothetical protein